MRRPRWGVSDGASQVRRSIWDAVPGTSYLGRFIWDAFLFFLSLFGDSRSPESFIEPAVTTRYVGAVAPDSKEKL